MHGPRSGCKVGRSLGVEMDWRAAALALIVMTGAAWVASCSSSSGATSGAGPDGGVESSAGDAGATYAASACGTCVGRQCASQIMACSSDPDCAKYLACLDACPVGPGGDVDAKCAAACPVGTSTTGMQAESALTDCRNTGAGATCAACGVDGGTSSLLMQTCPAPPMEDRCATCEDQHCCQSIAACDKDPICDAFKLCLQECVNQVAEDAGEPDATAPDGGDVFACDKYCEQSHPGGLTKWSQAIACVTYFCSDTNACGSSALPTCQSCTYQQCANQWVAVNATPDGQLLADCLIDCPAGNNPCTVACTNMVPNLMPLLSALTGCATAHCPTCTQ